MPTSDKTPRRKNTPRLILDAGAGSKKVNAYLKLAQKQAVIQARLTKALDRTKPLARRAAYARDQVIIYRNSLTGGQLARAKRLLLANQIVGVE